MAWVWWQIDNNGVGSLGALPSNWYQMLAGMKAIRGSQSRSVVSASKSLCVRALPTCSPKPTQNAVHFTSGGKRLDMGGIKDWLVKYIGVE